MEALSSQHLTGAAERHPMIALFPGQGSHKVGMGAALADSSSRARDIFAEADAALGFKLSKLCCDGPIEELTLTENAQPAILTVSVMAYEVAKEQLGDLLQPRIAAGHSLGEYSALVASGALNFSDAVRLVHKRGQFMQEAVAPGAGRMVAVLGKELEEIDRILSDLGDIACDVANINSPGQVVVSGSKDGISSFLEALGKAKVVELQVSAPFHCRLMAPARDKLVVELNATPFRRGCFPIVTNIDALPVQEPDEIRDALTRQVCGRVRWVECVNTALNIIPDGRVCEFGEGNILSGLMRRIQNKVEVHGVGGPADLERLALALKGSS